MPTMTRARTLEQLCRAASPATLDDFVRRLHRVRPTVGVRHAYLTAMRVRRERVA